MKATLYCFSGTGNTKFIAEKLSSGLGNCTLHILTADELRHPEEHTFQSDDQLIIWAFPTYSWGVPPIVRNILHNGRLAFPSSAVHLAVTTCGDDIGNMARMFRKDITSRGGKAGAVFSVQMPNTYVMMKGFDTDSESVARQKIGNSENQVERILYAIESGLTTSEDDITVRGNFAWFKTSLIYPWFVKFDMSPTGFNVDASKCISCGKCAQACPMDNISYDLSGHPIWGSECAFCSACYHVCPKHAIAWKKATLKKGQVKFFNSGK